MHLSQLEPFIGDHTKDDAGPHGRIRRVEVIEDDPLYALRGCLDAASRRVLPCHLLRRCRVMSSISLGQGTVQQRVFLVAATGEEANFHVLLRGTEEAQGQGLWRISQMSRDAADYPCPLPLIPHPRLSPEVVILAQVKALREGDMTTARAFMMPSDMFGLGETLSGQLSNFLTHQGQIMVSLAALRSGAPLSGPGLVQLGSGAVTNKGRTWVQEVHLSPEQAPGEETTYVWDLCLAPDGSWRVRGVQHTMASGLGPMPP